MTRVMYVHILQPLRVAALQLGLFPPQPKLLQPQPDMTQVILHGLRLHTRQAANSLLSSLPQLGATIVQSHCVNEPADESIPCYCTPFTRDYKPSSTTPWPTPYFLFAASPTKKITTVADITSHTCTARQNPFSPRKPSPLQTLVIGQNSSWRARHTGKTATQTLSFLYGTNNVRGSSKLRYTADQRR